MLPTTSRSAVASNSPVRSTLCKLLFLDETHVSFKSFMAPLSTLLSSLLPESLPSPAMSSALIGALRDMRGIVSACSNRRTYSLFFDWIYPDFTPLFARAARLYYDCPALTTPLLKLYAELVHNKTQRLTFDSSSPNGEATTPPHPIHPPQRTSSLHTLPSQRNLTQPALYLTLP